MSTWQIPKTNWTSADGVTNADMNRIEANTQFASVMQVAGGSTTAITLNIGTLVDGLLITFIAANSNGGSATTINGKHLYKPYSTNTPKIIANKAYTVWYNASGDCFFIKASAEGTAVAANVLAETTFSNDDDIGIAGAMPNNGAINITPSSSAHTIPAGFTTGGSVSAVSVPVANVLSGTTIAGQVGTMKNNGAVSGAITNQGQSISIPEGYTKGGSIVANFANLIASNIKKDVNIGSIIGTLDIASLGGKQYAQGNFNTSVPGYYSVNNLKFTPSLVLVVVHWGGTNYLAMRWGSYYNCDATYSSQNNLRSTYISSLDTNGFTFSMHYNDNATMTWIAFE